METALRIILAAGLLVGGSAVLGTSALAKDFNTGDNTGHCTATVKHRIGHAGSCTVEFTPSSSNVTCPGPLSGSLNGATCTVNGKAYNDGDTVSGTLKAATPEKTKVTPE